MLQRLQSACILMFLTFVGMAHAEVTISEAWVRASNPGQSVGAAYVTFNSPQTMRLISVKTERAERVELHSMTMDNGVMKMRRLDEIAIPENQAVALAPGGLHLMLFGFKQPFKADEEVTFKFKFKDSKGLVVEQIATLPVKSPQ